MTLTCLTACYVKQRLVIRLRFGAPLDIDWRDGGVTHYWFEPAQVFGVISKL